MADGKTHVASQLIKMSDQQKNQSQEKTLTQTPSKETDLRPGLYMCGEIRQIVTKPPNRETGQVKRLVQVESVRYERNGEEKFEMWDFDISEDEAKVYGMALRKKVLIPIDFALFKDKIHPRLRGNRLPIH